MGNHGNVAYSTDGVNWTTKIVGSVTWNGVCYGSGKFFAVGSGGAVTYSTDGVNWTTRMVESTTWNGVCPVQ